MSLEKRDLRVSLDRGRAPVSFDILNVDPAQRQDFKLVNISRGGMFIESPAANHLEAGSSLHFSIRLDRDDEEVSGVAKVRWIRDREKGPFLPKGLGVEVIEFHENTDRKYFDFLESCLVSLKITDLMDPKVKGLPDTASVGDALESLFDSGKTCVVIVDKLGKPIGLFSTTDAARLALRAGYQDEPLKLHMSRQPRVLSVDQTTEEAYRLLRHSLLENFPVVDDGIMVGMLSARELIPYWAEFADLQSKRLTRNYDRAMSIIAHDLRTPIGIVQTTNALLMSGELRPNEYVSSGFPEVLDGTCEMMLKLIDELLDLNSVKSGAIRLCRTQIDLEDLIDKVSRCFAPSAQSKDIAIEIDIPVAVPKIKADALRLEQVLNNLLSNAIKFTPEHGKIVVGLKPHHSQVALWIADNGPGIPANELALVFEEFSNISVKPSRGEKSTGLGLAITKRLVEAHDGTIRVDSERGCGTTFTVFLPIGELQ